VNFVPGKRLSLTTAGFVELGFAHTVALMAAPTVVLLVVSAVTFPLMTSVTVPLPEQPDPPAVVTVPVVDFPLTHLTVPDVSVIVPFSLPDPPVFPVHVLSLIFSAPVVVFAEPLNLEQEIPLATAPAGAAARAVMPATGTRTAVAAMKPPTIRFLITFAILLEEMDVCCGRRENQSVIVTR
jgi:hypothetical protein